VDEEELTVWQRLRAAHPRVSAETVLCGPGLERLYTALASDGPRRVGAIDAAARLGEPAAARAIALFTRWLGRVAGNLALTTGARGGVFLAGGILPRWGALFDATEFRRGFEDKAPLSAWLRAIPSYVVTHAQPGLLGLAELARLPAARQ
jgi:glucokinase